MPAATPTTPAAPLQLERLQMRVGNLPVEIGPWSAGRGECVALIGKNGCGKTTLMEALLGLRHVQVLSGTLLGAPLAHWARRAELRQQVGALLQRSAPPGGLYVHDLVYLHRHLYRRSSERVHGLLGIEALADKRYDRLSRGETQRVDLYMALAHEPQLVMLDEPFTGLDAQYADAAIALIRERGERSVVMSCHSVPELELATRITWLAAGSVVADDTAEHLRRSQLQACRMQVNFSDEAAAQRFVARAEGLSAVRWTRDGAQLTLAGDEAPLARQRAALDPQAVTALEFRQTTLADLLQHCAWHGTPQPAAPVRAGTTPLPQPEPAHV